MDDSKHYDSSKAKGITFGKATSLVGSHSTRTGNMPNTPDTRRFSNPKFANVGYSDLIVKAKRKQAENSIKDYEAQKAQKEADTANEARVQAQRLESARRREEERNRSGKELGNKLLEELKQQVAARMEAELREEIYEKMRKDEHIWYDEYQQQKKREITAQLEISLAPLVEAKIINSNIDEIKDRLTSELKPSVIEGLKQEFEQKVKEDLRAEFEADTRSYLRNELRSEVLEKLRKDNTEIVLEQLRKDNTKIVLDQLRQKYEPQVIEELRNNHFATENESTTDHSAQVGAVNDDKQAHIGKATVKNSVAMNEKNSTLESPAHESDSITDDDSSEESDGEISYPIIASDATDEPFKEPQNEFAIFEDPDDTVGETLERHDDDATISHSVANPAVKDNTKTAAAAFTADTAAAAATFLEDLNDNLTGGIADDKPLENDNDTATDLVTEKSLQQHEDHIAADLTTDSATANDVSIGNIGNTTAANSMTAKSLEACDNKTIRASLTAAAAVANQSLHANHEAEDAIVSSEKYEEADQSFDAQRALESPFGNSVNGEQVNIGEARKASRKQNDYSFDPDIHKINFASSPLTSKMSLKRSLSQDDDQEQDLLRQSKRSRDEGYAADGDVGFEEAPVRLPSESEEDASEDAGGEDQELEDDDDDDPEIGPVSEDAQDDFYLAGGSYNQFEDSEELDDESEDENLEFGIANNGFRFTNTQETAINLDDSDDEVDGDSTLVEDAGFVAVNKKGFSS